MVKLIWSDDFNKYIDDLFLPDSRIEEVVMVPYEETDNLATREKWRVVVKEKMFMSEKRHFTNAIRVYKLFKLVNKEKIYNTV
nr:162_t:CDS:2 [Entrophospora candida]